DGDPPATRQAVHDGKAGVVPGALVARTGIAEADDHPHEGQSSPVFWPGVSGAGAAAPSAGAAPSGAASAASVGFASTVGGTTVTMVRVVSPTTCTPSGSLMSARWM